MIVLLLAAHQTLHGAVADQCPDDNFSCSCTINANRLANIWCTNVEPNTIKEQLANANTLGRVLAGFTITGNTNALMTLPANLTAGRVFVFGGFSCSNGAQPMIDPNTFIWGPENQGITFGSGCNFIRQQNFLFLNGFAGWQLIVNHAQNIQGFRTIGTVPNLQEFIIRGNTGLGAIAHRFPNVSPSRVRWFTLDNNNLNDAQTNAILASIPTFVEGVWLWNEKLTRVPDAMRRFGPRLLEFEILGTGNNIPVMTNYSMQLYGGMVNFRLDGLGIQYMETDSIMGNAQ